ncbi:hypothetical protein [Paraburkholderia bryophila]|uniref:Uncharacterized protein n=1 Tax=Paraburkholderia bryophila TaxID=420952 RepID=A0A329BQ90_9BURK|nr:hypothetical protein [Paraburkholderia bryophila]RAS21085.1 hypothetical protein BX591_13145 [Paraburkholderia bryophila]
MAVIISMFFLLVKDYAVEYVAGSASCLIGIMLMKKIASTKWPGFLDVPWYKTALPIYGAIFGLALSLLGVLSKINGGSAAIAFALPASLGTALYDYAKIIHEEGVGK